MAYARGLKPRFRSFVSQLPTTPCPRSFVVVTRWSLYFFTVQQLPRCSEVLAGAIRVVVALVDE